MLKNTEKTMDKLVALCKNRGFVFAGSEIYGGLANTWDYGPLGVEMKNNIKRAWWKKFVQENPCLLYTSPTEPRTNGTGTLQISTEDTQTRSAGEIYTALRPSLALVYADGNGGTAIVMTADGYLITNAHTVSGAESITVQLSDGTEYAAALSGMDESSDLAVLKIEPETALQPAEFGDSAGAAAGDTVYVFSHPFGAAFDNATMTDGSIAAVQSGVRIGAETLNVFQTDAAPDSGSAGGPY